MSLYEGAVKKPIMTSLCFLAVVIFGLFSLSKLPIDLYPDIDTNTIMVMTAYPGASASDIENNVTRPLENTLNAVSNLKHITSRSSENMSLITLEFEFGNDIDVLTNDVRDKLDMVSSQLPDDVENPIIFKFSLYGYANNRTSFQRFRYSFFPPPYSNILGVRNKVCYKYSTRKHEHT